MGAAGAAAAGATGTCWETVTTGAPAARASPLISRLLRPANPDADRDTGRSESRKGPSLISPILGDAERRVLLLGCAGTRAGCVPVPRRRAFFGLTTPSRIGPYKIQRQTDLILF